MSITDIPLSNGAAPSTVVDLGTVVQTGKGPLSSDPQSGSIMKILMENGFRDKIEEGNKKGHTYTILHAAPSPDFTLIDSWTETTTDPVTGPATNPRKTYQFFKITDPVQPGTPQSLAKPRDSSPNEGEPTPETSVTTEIPVVALPAAEVAPVAVPVEQPPAAPMAEIVVPVVEEKPVMQHHEAKSWLQEKLGQPHPVSQSETILSTNVERVKFNTSSYDLLKNRFAQATTANTVSKTESIPLHVQTSDKKQLILESAFGGPIEGMLADEWNKTKMLPARPFAYPTEYSWGTDANGKPIEHTLDQYPAGARKLRDKITSLIDGLKKKDVDTDTMTVGDALDQADRFGML